MNGQPSDLTDQLTALQTMGRAELSDRWLDHYGHAPPPKTAHSLLVMAVAYKIQEATRGGLKSSTTRRLKQLTTGAAVSSSAASLKPGTVLVREWHGTTHSLTVLDKGVLMNGKTYRSLTEVARLISGVHQSGHNFFGLKSKIVRANSSNGKAHR